MPRRFNFTGPDGDHETKMGFQVNLGETPTMSCLDQLFEDLFLQWRVNPSYLFVSKKDIEPLTQKILEGTNFCGPVMAGSEIYDNDPANHGPLSAQYRLTKYINATTGKLIDLVPLPGLEPNHVIIGFFR